MSFALMTNFACMILCAAVLLQSGRLMRSLKAVRSGALTDTVQSLERATAQARAVLADMKATLGNEFSANGRLVEQAVVLRDELAMMIEIGDATAERIAGAASAGNAVARENQAEVA